MTGNVFYFSIATDGPCNTISLGDDLSTLNVFLIDMYHDQNTILICLLPSSLNNSLVTSFNRTNRSSRTT
jgi:hypothetical protein